MSAPLVPQLLPFTLAAVPLFILFPLFLPYSILSKKGTKLGVAGGGDAEHYGTHSSRIGEDAVA